MISKFIIKLCLATTILLLLINCNAQTKNQTPNSDTMNVNEIKKHIELQKRIELSENDVDTNHVYHYSENDMNIALPLIFRGLKKNGFIPLEKNEFLKRVEEIFGGILTNSNCRVKNHEKFYSVLINPSIKEEEFDYTVDNIFISKEYSFITDLPMLSDFVNITDNDSCNINLSEKIIYRNKYFFNNSKQYLPYLINNDKDFIETLVIKYGYTKEEAFNKIVLDEFKTDKKNIKKVGEIIFVKNCKGKLEVRRELLKYIFDNTSATDNKLLQDGLARYAYAIYDKDDPDQIYSLGAKPYDIFSIDEKREIIAYITSIYDPLFIKYKNGSDGDAPWDAVTPIENILVADPGILDAFKKNNYYNIPGLKEIITETNFEPTPKAD